MIPRECRRLAEVDFPIAEVSRHAVREKSIRHGHPSTLHVWWARRPLASSRAMLMALLLPDPADKHCPAPFKDAARGALLAMRGRASGWDAEIGDDAGLRRVLLRFVAAFADWDHSARPEYIKTARTLVLAAHPGEPPLVADPFAGGGSIPLEALRLGCDAFASDLNPVACLILKVLLEDVPRHGSSLADELRRTGALTRDAAARELAAFYPPDPDGATPIAWLWARTVRCEAPDCGAEIPLLRSFWLARKPARSRTPARLHALAPVPSKPRRGPKRIEFKVFEPKSHGDVEAGTVTGGRARCLCCGAALARERVRAQLAAQRGGADVVFDAEGRRTGGARITAVVTRMDGEGGRRYRPATDADYDTVWRAHRRLDELLGSWKAKGGSEPCPVPDEPLPPVGTLGFRVQRYGMLQWGDLFTARQKVALEALTRVVRSGRDNASDCMALVVDRCAKQLSSLSYWHVTGEKVEGIFSRQAVPMVWDFTEGNPFSNATGGYDGQLNWVAEVIESHPESEAGASQMADAAVHPLPSESAGAWFTDPPYYDAIPYADLSDFFLVWLKRALPGHPLLRDPFDSSNPLSPKEREIVQDATKQARGRVKDRQFFEEAMGAAFAEGRRILRDDGIGSVVFAHKTTEGWEAMLAGLIGGGWTITGSWPIATEMGARLRARESAALETSVHLIVRPRPADAPVGDWADVLRELPERVGEWIERLQAAGLRGADLVFACIGPALEIFSRYRAVESAGGAAIGLTVYLERVWEEVGRAALDHVLGTAEARNGAAGGLEKDALLTALFLWTLQGARGAGTKGDAGEPDGEEVGGAASDEPTGRMRRRRGYGLPFDVVRRFAQPLGIDLPEWEGIIVDTDLGVVRLKPVIDRRGQLFGEAGADGLADQIEAQPGRPVQLGLFPDEPPEVRGRARRRPRSVAEDATGADDPRRDATTLDRVHAAMLLQASGRSGALRALLREEQGRGPGFARLANALSALYPVSSSEKRLLDAMLLAMP